MSKDYVSDLDVRVFDKPIMIKQCWNHLTKLSGEKKAFIFTDRKNNHGGKDYYFSVRCENGIYIVSLDKNNEIVKIVRF